MQPFFHLVDLSHLVEENSPTWSGRQGFKFEIRMDYPQGARVLKYHHIASVGTHIDAPTHFIPDGKSIDSLDLNDLFSPAHIIDVSKNAKPDYKIPLSALEEHEKLHGKIAPNSIVIANTGWFRLWDNPEKFRCEDAEGKLHFPSFAPEVGEFLIEREIAGLGIDTLSPDSFGDGYPLHHLLLGKGKFILENLNNLDKLPPKGAYISAFPCKIRHGTEYPVRAVGYIPV